MASHSAKIHHSHGHSRRRPACRDSDHHGYPGDLDPPLALAARQRAVTPSESLVRVRDCWLGNGAMEGKFESRSVTLPFKLPTNHWQRLGLSGVGPTRRGRVRLGSARLWCYHDGPGHNGQLVTKTLKLPSG